MATGKRADATRSMVSAANQAPPPKAMRNATTRSVGLHQNDVAAPRGREQAPMIPIKNAVPATDSTIVRVTCGELPM